MFIDPNKYRDKSKLEWYCWISRLVDFCFFYGKETFQQNNDHRPELILMDIVLPGKKRLILTRKIKNLYPQITIAIFTNHDVLEYRDAAFENGAVYSIFKLSSHKNKLSRVIELVPAGAD
jgi:DNA-binding NarL/FixJ family response regulator